MKTSELRERLIKYLSKAEDRKVEALYTLLEEDIDADAEFSLTEEHIKIIEDERRKYLNGEGKSYTWPEAKELIKGKKAS